MDVSPTFDEARLVTEPVLTLEEKRAIALTHLNSVEHGTKRGGFSLPREHFNPKSRRHVESYNTYLTTGSWGSVQFHQEYPYDSVIETVTRKFALSMMEQLLTSENRTKKPNALV